MLALDQHRAVSDRYASRVMRRAPSSHAIARRPVQAFIAVLAGLLALVLAASALASGTLHVVSRSWEVGEETGLHKVASGGKFSFCPTQPVTALTTAITYAHAPVGKSYTVKMVGPKAAGTIPPGAKTRIAKSSGRVDITFATPSFPGHQLAAGKYAFSMLLGGKTVASLKLTLLVRTGC
jgi:hypothetical protein